MLRAVIGARMPLAALAFASGCIFSVWAVIMAPLIPGSVEEKRRPTAFSVFFACMFATGIFGSWLGGRLPQWLHGKQPVLLLSAAMAGAGGPSGVAVEGSPRRRPKARGSIRAAGFWRCSWCRSRCGTWLPGPSIRSTTSISGGSDLRTRRSARSFRGAQLVQVVAVLLAPLDRSAGSDCWAGSSG